MLSARSARETQEMNIDISITKNNIHIEDSFDVPKRDIKGDLVVILEYADRQDCKVCNRSLKSLCLEWYAHNLLYRLHIQRARTKDVDLNFPQSWKERVFYAIIGTIAWIFID